MNEFEKRKRAWDRTGEEIRQLKAENERLQATCKALADALENLLAIYEKWDTPLHVSKETVDRAEAAIAQCKADHDST